MNIYIYGNKSFKKKISKILKKDSIEHRLDGIGEIININSPAILKEAVLSNPRDMFLIDHEKIITKNFFNKTIKFLKPEDGIEKEFLEEYGVGDVCVDDISDISKHIIMKIKALELEQNDFKNKTNDTIDIEKIDEKNDELIKKNKAGDIMAELTQLDEISEEDIVDALSGMDGIDVTSDGSTIKVSSAESKDEIKQNHTIEVDSLNMSNITTLLEQLMDNKTLEISIKVKS